METNNRRVWEIQFSHKDENGRWRYNRNILVIAESLQKALDRFMEENYDDLQIWSITNRSGGGKEILEA